VKCALRAHWSGRAKSALGWKGGERFTRGGDARGVNGGDASTGRVGGGIEAECRCAWRLTFQPSVLGVGLLVKARWMMLMGTTTVSHVGWFTMQRGRDWGEPVRICSRNATFRVYLVHPEVRNMSEAFREYLLHLDDSRSCSGPALTSDAATSRMYLLHLDSMRNESA